MSREPKTKAHYSLTPPTKWNRGCYQRPRNQLEQALTHNRKQTANVAPRFIKAYRSEEIPGDQLEALAITDDQQAIELL